MSLLQKVLFFSILYILIVHSDKMIICKQGPTISKQINDVNVEISWTTNLPIGYSLQSIEMYVQFNGVYKEIATFSIDGTTLLVSDDKLPEDLIGRLETTLNGIVIKKLDFDKDQQRKFTAKLKYSYNQRIYNELSDEINLFITYPVEFYRLDNEISALENSDGDIVCIARAYPAPNLIYWDTGNIKFTNSIRSIIFNDNLKINYGIDPKSKLFYVGSILTYIKINRNQSQKVTCMVKNYIDTIFTASIEILVLFGTEPPSNVMINQVSDKEAFIKWTGSKPDTGNPKKVLYYIVEYLPENQQNTIKTRHNNIEDIHASDPSNEIINKNNQWISYNTSNTEAVIYNLVPLTSYRVRIKAFNGVTYSEPSTEIIIKTKSKSPNSIPNYRTSQPLLIIVICGSAIFTFLLIIIFVTYFVGIRARRRRQWAVLNRSNHPLNEGDKKNENVDNYNIPFNNKLNDEGAFSNLPPPIISTQHLNNIYNMPINSRPNDNTSLKSFTTREDATSIRSYLTNNYDFETKVATKFVNPPLNKTPTREDQSVKSQHSLSSKMSYGSHKSAYV